MLIVGTKSWISILFSLGFFFRNRQLIHVTLFPHRTNLTDTFKLILLILSRSSITCSTTSKIQYLKTLFGFPLSCMTDHCRNPFWHSSIGSDLYDFFFVPYVSSFHCAYLDGDILFLRVIVIDRNLLHSFRALRKVLIFVIWLYAQSPISYFQHPYRAVVSVKVLYSYWISALSTDDDHCHNFVNVVTASLYKLMEYFCSSWSIGTKIFSKSRRLVYSCYVSFHSWFGIWTKDWATSYFDTACPMDSWALSFHKWAVTWDMIFEIWINEIWYWILFACFWTKIS